MGHNSSRGNEQVNISINHGKFLNSKVIKEFQKQILRTKITCDQKTYKNWKHLLQKYKSIHHQYMLLPLNHKYCSTALCATRGDVQIDYENYPYLMIDEIQYRKESKAPFTQPQLWYLLYAYLSAKHYLKEHFDYPYDLLGDIRPQNIFINQNGEVKFSNLFSWPCQKINYLKTFDGITTYLSPQDYQLLQLGSMNNQKNQKSQFFSIGFTLISAATLRDNKDVYNIEKQKFDIYEAKKRINSFKCLTIYSELLRAIISSLCSLQSKKRIQFHDLWIWITKYERRIMTKQPFMIQQVPLIINQQINALRSQLPTISPVSSTLNLNSIKSLKGSQSKVDYSSVNKVQNIKEIQNLKEPKFVAKTLKEVQNTNHIENESQKSKSRIVIKTGVQQKVFYSPTNGAYFTSQVTQNSQISQIKSVNGDKNSKIQSFFSPPSKIQNKNWKLQNKDWKINKLQKSPQGFYSPRGNNSKNFRVFIQYKSPKRPIQKPYAQTIYIGKQGQKNIKVVQNMETTERVFRKQSDSKSQKSKKSGDSNRKNRFIQQTIKEQQKKLLQKKLIDERTSQIKNQKQKYLKPKSPIQEITTNQQNITHGVSQVVSEEIIISPTQVKNQKEKNTNQQQFQSFQISFNIKDDFPKQDSNIVSVQNLYASKDSQYNSSPHKITDSITSEVLASFHGLNQVKRGSSKKISLHDSIKYQEQLSRTQDMNRIAYQLTQSQLLRIKQEEQLNKLTFDDGHNVVLPQKENTDDSVKFDIESRHQKFTKISKHSGANVLPYQQLITQIFPVEKEVVKRKKTLPQIEEEKHHRMQDQLKRKLAQIEQSERDLIDKAVKQVIDVQKVQKNEQNKQVVPILKSQYKEQLKQDQNELNMIENLQREVLQMGNQIIQMRTNFQNLTPSYQIIQKKPQPPVHQQITHQQNNNEALFTEHISTQQIIDNQISSQKESQQFKPLQQANHSEYKNEEIEVQRLSNSPQILIVDEDLGQDPENNNINKEHIQVVSLQNAKQDEIHNKNIDQRPLIPLGPQKTSHKQVQSAQIIETKIQNILNVQQPVLLQVRQLQSHQLIVNGQINQINNNIPLILPNQVVQVVSETVISTVRTPLIPPQQQQYHQQPSQFHSSHIQSIVPVQQKVILFQQEVSKLSQNKQVQQFQNANHSLPQQENQIHSQQNENHQEVIQQVTDVSIHDNNTITSYKTVEYSHHLELGGHGSGNQVIYNVIEVNDNSQPLNNINQDSEINGSGKIHSRVMNGSDQIIQIQKVERILPNDIIANQHNIIVNQHDIIVNQEPQLYAYEATKQEIIGPITVVEISEMVTVEPLQTEKQKIINQYKHANSFDDHFLQDIQQTNKKLRQLEQQQQKSKDHLQSNNQLQINQHQNQIPIFQTGNQNHQKLNYKHNNNQVQYHSHQIHNNSSNDHFLNDVQQTNRKLIQIHQQQEQQKIINQPFVIHHLKLRDLPSLQPHTQNVILQSAHIQKVDNNTQQINNINNSQIGGTSKEHTGSEIKNSQIQFDTLKQVVGGSKQIHKYQVVYEEPLILHSSYQLTQQIKSNQQSNPILPVNSNPNQQDKPQLDHLQFNHQKIDQLQASVIPSKSQNNHHNHNIPAQGNYLQFTNLQLTLPGAPTQSEFGNISQIMDIDKEFNNTLNAKQRNFLQGTADPRSEEFFRQLINLSQKGKIQEADLEKVTMTRQDRDKLTNFMKKWQNYNPQEESNVQHYIDEFRNAITRSQMEHQEQQNENQDAKIRMSAQDKQTLRLVIDKLNGRSHLMSVTPSDKRYPMNYDQSYVNVECSDMKTDILIGEKDGHKDRKQKNQQNQQVIDPRVVNILTTNIQRIAEQLQDETLNKQRGNNSKQHDIIDQIITINKNLTQNIQDNPVVLQSSPEKQFNDNYSTQVNPATTRFSISTLQQLNKNETQNSPGFFGGVLNTIKTSVNKLNQIIEDAVVDNSQNQIRGSQVDASVGQKSQREDPQSSDIHNQNVSESATMQNLHILRNHRTYSQPNNFFDKESLSSETSPVLNNRTVIGHSTIQEQTHENEEHLTEEHILQNTKLVKDLSKDLIEQIKEINHTLQNSIKEVIEEPVIETIIQQKITTQQKIMTQQKGVNDQKIEQVKIQERSSQRKSKAKDFLDEVMQVNKILNHQEHKDYYEDNKYLKSQNQGI